MCNIENVKYSIELMKNAKNLDLRHWQRREGYGFNIRQTTEELHSCGTSACFAGEVAVSKKFKQDGGRVHRDGRPAMSGALGELAISEWLGISLISAENICGLGGKTEAREDIFYGKLLEDITPQDVIEKLEELLVGCE